MMKNNYSFTISICVAFLATATWEYGGGGRNNAVVYCLIPNNVNLNAFPSKHASLLSMGAYDYSSSSKVGHRKKISSSLSSSTVTSPSTAAPPRNKIKKRASMNKKNRPQQQQQQGKFGLSSNKSSSSNNNNKRSKKVDHDYKPWVAPYHISTKTQSKIKAAAHSVRGGNSIHQASAVLKTFLSTPPYRCNEANVVCALTLSAKLMGVSPKTTDNFRSMLFKTLNVLNELVHKKQLNTRQLCNAAWAIAKHYNRDETLLPQSPELVAMSTDGVGFGVAETWDLKLNESDNEKYARMLDETINEIASQLIELLRNEEEQVRMYKYRKEIKVGEICMASWAYGILRPRRRPPGWQVLPQMARLPQDKRQNGNSKSKSSSSLLHGQITFETLQDTTAAVKNIAEDDITDKFFDAIGRTLCKQPVVVNNNKEKDSRPTAAFMRLESCTWKEIANVAWAFATHGRCTSKASEELLLNLSREAVRRMTIGGEETRYMLSRDIAQLVWSLGTLQSDNFRLADDLIDLTKTISDYVRLEGAKNPNRPFKNWSCPDIVQMILSLAHARIDELPLLHRLYGEALYRLSDGISTEDSFQKNRMSFRAWEVSILLWAQARLNLRHPEGQTFESFAEEAPKTIYLATKKGNTLEQLGIGPQEQANMAWSLTILERYNSIESIKLLAAVFRDAAVQCQENGMIQLEHAHQLWQALFLLEEDSPQSVENVPMWFREYLREKWSVEKTREKISSARHRSLSQTLDLMGINHYNEHDEDIDIAIVLRNNASWSHQTEKHNSNNNEVRVAVEFDGPNHFTRETIYQQDYMEEGEEEEQVRALGHTVLKYRLLKKQGWTVVRVPYYEFDKIPFWASMERQRYLQRKLKTHANIRFSGTDVSEYTSLSPNRISRFE